MIVATVLGTGLLFILIIATIGLLLGPPDDEPMPHESVCAFRHGRTDRRC